MGLGAGVVDVASTGAEGGMASGVEAGRDGETTVVGGGADSFICVLHFGQAMIVSACWSSACRTALHFGQETRIMVISPNSTDGGKAVFALPARTTLPGLEPGPSTMAFVPIPPCESRGQKGPGFFLENLRGGEVRAL